MPASKLQQDRQWVDTNTRFQKTGDGEVLELNKRHTNLRRRELLVSYININMI